MKNKNTIASCLSSLLLSLVASQSFAVQSNVCNDDYKVLQNLTQIQMGTLSPGICYLSIDPFNNINLVYRSYILSTDSSLMVFNSYGDGPPMTMTGAREFMFFPRTESLNYVTDTKNLGVEMSGIQFTMDIASTKFIKIDGVQFQEATSIARTNGGGLNIVSSQKLYLDLGFKMGAAPRTVASATSVFHDAKSETCRVVNTNIFDYKDPENPVLKFANDKDLAAYLKIQCANLDLSSL